MFGRRECWGRRARARGGFPVGFCVRVGEFVERVCFTEPCSESLGDRIADARTIVARTAEGLDSAGDEGIVGAGGRRWLWQVERFGYD
ncbi:hypothetical protein [Streptomyces sp. ME18-1-4]|uniref:hypothetical protein n=1 Tax=Streptomyces sp. ME18-1-4 TaxID=3028685 RepID=UPI0029A804F3|nr:hypothetical protein [Streptomyces sp. ME18-1-4]MDX3248990.1 hypothetical protein [Streptomyces sp. ME18-1-4]